MLPSLIQDESTNLILGTLLAALICTLICYSQAYKKWISINQELKQNQLEENAKDVHKLRSHLLTQPMGKQEWDFSSSWTTSITALGGFLGAVVTAQISSDQNQVGLNLFFGLLVLLAPIFYRTTARYALPDQESTQTDSVAEPQGCVFGFFLTTLITLWAVFGELITITIMLTNMSQNPHGVQPIQVFFWIFLGIALLSMVVYTLQAIPWTVEEQITIAYESQRKEPATRPALPAWKLL